MNIEGNLMERHKKHKKTSRTFVRKYNNHIKKNPRKTYK